MKYGNDINVKALLQSPHKIIFTHQMQLKKFSEKVSNKIFRSWKLRKEPPRVHGKNNNNNNNNFSFTPLNTKSVCKHGVFILKLILSYLPVHLISPTLYLPDTHIKHFSHSPSGKHLAACHVRLAPTRLQLRYHTHTPFNSQIDSYGR